MVRELFQARLLFIVEWTTDSEPDSCRDVVQLLRCAGADIQQVCSMETGCSLAPSADLIMIQLDLGETLRLGKTLRSLPDTATIPLLYLSSRFPESEFQEQEQLIELVDSFLTLPVSSLTLLTTIRSLLCGAEELRKRTAAALQQQHDWLNLALDAARMGSWDWDLRSGQFLWSSYHEEIFGYEPGTPQRTYQEWSERVHPEDLSRVDTTLQTAIANQADYECEYRVCWPDGNIRWVMSLGRCYYNSQGEPSRMVGMLLDTTQRKYTEQLLQQQAAELSRINRIKDEFLATLSHELRTPLNAILGWAQLLQQRQFEPQKAAYGLEIIERNARLQTQLVEDLLDISRITQGKLRINFRPLDLLSVIRGAIATVAAAAAAKQIDLSCSVTPSPGVESPGLESLHQEPPSNQLGHWIVLGDSDRLQQILWNLLSNAIKFTPQGGRVEVRLVKVERGPWAADREGTPPSPHSSPSAAYAQIQVIDTGIGLDPEIIPFVFNHFYQGDSSTTRAYGGLGLGLAIVRQLAELHGGFVLAESQGIGCGSIFTVTLPLQSPNIEPSTPYSNLPSSLPNPGV